MLRTIRFGEADIIAHLYTRDLGRLNVIAKGARRTKSRLGARLEPFFVTQVMLRRSKLGGEGGLRNVQSVDVLSAHDQIRASWTLQSAGAGALDLLGRLSEEGVANEPAYHLTVRLLAQLDDVAAPDPVHVSALVGAWELKLLHLAGLAPQLGVCVRCGGETNLTHVSSEDGGVACLECSLPRDRALDPGVLDAAIWLMRSSLPAVA
ncbi:MAG: DNA repair protein RecO, partial [Thermoleophilia bacterium]|nr:DNA repair protein RecO [Thermoleophilia bacterium]